MNDDSRMEECMKFEEKRIENLQKLQKIQSEIKSANRKREDDDEGDMGMNDGDEEEDEYEDYFSRQMLKDMEIVEEHSA